MNYRSLIIALVLFCFAASGVLAQKRGPSTPEERKRAVELTTALENDPLNKKAEDWRRELLVWLIEVPDISVTICTGMLGDYSKIKGDHAGTVTTQLSFGGARFIIEHPDQANDEYQVYLAGVESSLRAYQNIKKAKPKVRFEPLEQLLIKQQQGQLADFIKTTMVDCK
ncbi:MAG TPA: hypothetical protein VJT50_10585 [Pyrinomonadaceae bacterium]|nr:hypothetical protein [Pyrinomonadaceae bacterium]